MHERFHSEFLVSMVRWLLMTCDTSISDTQLWRWVGISGLVAEMKSELLLDSFSEHVNNQP